MAEELRPGADAAAPGADSGAHSGELGEFYLKALEFSQAEKQFEARLATTSGTERAAVLRQIGHCRERRGEHRSALEALREAEAQARAAGDAIEEGRAAYLIAKVLYLTGDLAGGREVARRAGELLAGADDPGEHGRVENLLGGIAYREGDLHRARRHFEEALLLGKDSQNLTLLSRTHNNLGLIHKAMCDWDQAIDSFHASLGFDSTAANYDSRYTAWINLGIVHSKRSEWREAETMFQRAHKTCVEVGNPLGQVRSLLGQTSVLRARRDHGRAETCLIEAAGLARAHRYRRELVLVDAMRAWMALDRGDLAAARRHLDEALPRAEFLAPAGELMCHLLRLEATLALELDDVESTYEKAHACAELAKKCGDRYERATVARIEGAALARLGRWTDAVQCFARGERDLRRMRERHVLGLTLKAWGAGELGHAAQPDVGAALERLREAVHLLEQVGDRAALAAAHHALAEIFHRRGRHDEALQALQAAWTHLDDAPAEDALRAALAPLQQEVEEQMLEGTCPGKNRVLGLVELIESAGHGDASAGVARLLDQIGELVGADGALLASEASSGLKAEAASGLRLTEKRAILELLDDERDSLAGAGRRVLFAADPRGSTLSFAPRLWTVRPAASLVVLPLVDQDDRLWVLYLDRDRQRRDCRPFSNADLELVTALSEHLPALIAGVERRHQPATGRPGDPADELELGDFVCVDPQLRELLASIAQIRGSSIRVLLQGETGTGKGLLARVIHRNSVRRDRPFRVLNCATLPEALLESELFGHVRGAFTGASADKIGLLEEADGGTIFLDDIEKAGRSVQRGLLHFLDAGEIRPVGSTRRRSLDVRVICATSSPDLEENVRQNTFSKDLFYRLHHFIMTVPPLRERRASILPLARHFLGQFVEGGAIPEISPAATRLLESHDWPGNVRELENAMRRAAVLARHARVIEPELLPPGLFNRDGQVAPVPAVKGTLQEQVAALEAARVREALKLLDGNKSRTAERLGLTRKGLRNKMRRYGIEG